MVYVNRSHNGQRFLNAASLAVEEEGIEPVVVFHYLQIISNVIATKTQFCVTPNHAVSVAIMIKRLKKFNLFVLFKIF